MLLYCSSSSIASQNRKLKNFSLFLKNIFRCICATAEVYLKKGAIIELFESKTGVDVKAGPMIRSVIDEKPGTLAGQS